MAQEVDSPLSKSIESQSSYLYLPESDFVVNPFPIHLITLVQPIDSTSRPKGILDIKFDSRKTEIILAKDWSTITINEYIDGKAYRMPFRSDVEWYLSKYNERKSYQKLIEIMQKESKQI